MTRCEKNTHFRATCVSLCHNIEMGGRGGQQPGALRMFRWVFFSLAPESDVALRCESIARLSSFGPALALGSTVPGVGHGCAPRLNHGPALGKKESALVYVCVFRHVFRFASVRVCMRGTFMAYFCSFVLDTV